MASFVATLKSFCKELRLTLPELKNDVDRAVNITATQYWNSWKDDLELLLKRDFGEVAKYRKGVLLANVKLTPDLWTELSVKTQAAIWSYLRTLVLESAMLVNLDGLDSTQMTELNGILMAERLEKGGAEATEEVASELFEESMSHMKPLMEKLKNMMSGFVDLSAGTDSFKFPEIPERLRNGHIAKLAEELAKQFDPTEFGIDPSLLNSDNMEEILTKLAEMYQRDPSMLITGAKRIAEKIKTRILGGSINRDALMSEAKEFVEIFKEHPLFKEAIARFEGLMGDGGIASMFGSGGGGSGAGSPSERRSAVQERLRKKLAERQAKRGGGGK